MEQLKAKGVWHLEEVWVGYPIIRYFVSAVAKILLPSASYRQLFFQYLVFRHISKC